MSEPIVVLRDIVKSYRRGQQRVPVLERISFDIAAGEFLALMGPSGSGKSTLLNLIAGIDRPDSGTLRVAGERLPVQAGDVIFIPAGPEYPHQILNTSDAPLKYLSISTKEYPEICEYPDSAKVMAQSFVDGNCSVRTIHKLDTGLDYWHDEP